MNKFAHLLRFVQQLFNDPTARKACLIIEGILRARVMAKVFESVVDETLKGR